MPINIGSQVDVPAAGDPIVSPWYQDTSRKLVHQFATTADRNAWTSRPEGAHAYCADVNRTFLWDGAAWRQMMTTQDEDTTPYAPLAGAVLTGQYRWGADPDAGTGAVVRPDGAVKTTLFADDSAHTVLSANVSIVRAKTPVADVGGVFALFRRSGGTVASATTSGSITIATATTVAYGTTSDPRTKTPPPLTRGIGDAMARAQLLGASAWVGQHLDDDGEPDGVDYDLLSSHDVEDVAPYAVIGERDGVATDEHVAAGLAAEVGAPVWQQVSFPDLVPLLFAALSGALSRIDALEAAAGL